jgi:hypothetical protein
LAATWQKGDAVAARFTGEGIEVCGHVCLLSLYTAVPPTLPMVLCLRFHPRGLRRRYRGNRAPSGFEEHSGELSATTNLGEVG